ncbi:MAG: hypothetical protein ACR2JG_04960 [Geodermatophilaceae bacterium]
MQAGRPVRLTTPSQSHVLAVFALFLVAGPAWDTSRQRREQAGWDDHAAFMDELLQQGFVVMGGPIGDGQEILLIVEATGDAEVTARLQPDPWFAMGILQIGQIQRWTVWLDGRAVTSKR